MQFYYGDKMPLRVLDEIEFWKLQEAEHTVVIRELVDNLEERFRTALQQWEQSFSEVHARTRRFIETLNRSGGHIGPQVSHKVIKLAKFSLHQSEDFISLVNEIATQSKAAGSNQTAIVVLNHIRRESEYFIGITQTVLYGTP
ncbi:DUF2935 domain-containing protein [Alicyclobacillus fastidiosus]|uniref:DUF2935 domain-containing protein n=1 Tax=Alicyclobacillus fastidiosus TaxID=392011 RepID=A0ABY6ZCR1_9BACL|nr:DUF2935 domain-containing protein [Alicyclobacillus fastidiosus]WAH40632.1 DUF2935 domain-containing protein [Alicyclobacillus fastidiosus]GMA62078.1 hypothetical protein GCM10025859_25180 [Alicyclobacillus fastidiosus]